MNTSLPTLDVVIPCYNEAGDIAACLDALLVQADDIRRIIVVDNNSTDDTKHIVADYADAHDGITLITESRQGAQYARTTGLLAAQADVVARIDADTRVAISWAAALRTYYEAHPEVSVATGATEYHDLPARRLTNFMTWFFMYASNKLIGGSIGLYGANMSIRTTLWREISDEVKMNPDIMEDLSISLVLQAKGYKIAYIKDAFARVSGRRMRTAPRQFAKYNAQWWRTYAVYGHHTQAACVRVLSWFGNALQAPLAWILQHHDPATGAFSLRRVSRFEQRILP